MKIYDHERKTLAVEQMNHFHWLNFYWQHIKRKIISHKKKNIVVICSTWYCVLFCANPDGKPKIETFENGE